MFTDSVLLIFSHVGNTFISLLVKMYLEVVRLIHREGVGRKQGQRHLGRLSLADTKETLNNSKEADGQMEGSARSTGTA